MRDALVVLSDRDGCSDLLREAAAYATGADADLVLYSPLTATKYEDVVSTLDRIGEVENREYREEDAIGAAHRFANDLADEVLAGTGVEWSVVADVVDEVEAERLMEVADANGCDHVFTLGRRRSPTGKAVFGDATQRLLLNFDGYVTVKMD